MKYQVQLILLVAVAVLVAVCDSAPTVSKNGFDYIPGCARFQTEESCDDCCRGVTIYSAGMVGQGSIVDATIFERFDSYDHGCRCKGIQATGQYKLGMG